jgi:hypothetical protein
MAHLDKLPTYFVKADERRAAYYTIDATELLADGWAEEGEKAVAAVIHKPLPEIPVEAGVDAFDVEPEEDIDEPLEAMTKNELLEYAMKHGIDLKNNLPKAEILKACKEI